MLANFGAYEPTNSFATCTWDTGSTTLVSHMTRPRLDQRTLHREVFIRQQSRIAGLLQHGLKQILGNLTLQQPVPILREHGHIPDAVIHLKTHGPTNQRNSELYSSCSINIRSLRIEYRTWSSRARESCSGATQGQPVRDYNLRSFRSNRANARFVISRVARNGWPAGIRASRDTYLNIVD